MSRLPGFALAMSLAAASPAGAETRIFTGYAYAAESGTPLYAEHHQEIWKDGVKGHCEVTYRRPDGTIIARKQLDFHDSQIRPRFALEDLRSGYREGHIGPAGDNKVTVYRQLLGGGEREQTDIEISEPAAIDAGFDALLRHHLEDLRRGGELRFALVVPNYLRAFDLVATAEPGQTIDGRATIHLTAKSQSWLLRWFADPITAFYDAQDERLLEYRGPSNLYDEDGRAYRVRIVYPEGQAPPAGFARFAGAIQED